MNFFEHQDKAKRQTWRLLALFALAVVAVVTLTALVITVVANHFVQFTEAPFDPRSLGLYIANPIFIGAALGTFALIILGSLFKSLQLGGNGIQVALSMNAKHIHPDTTDPEHRRLLNLVTEMALASGNPVPKVFLLPGEGINAFAAGYNRHQTVVAVTKGALQQLTRDELQGVIAHEFSHINFGDVKINMRLVALLHGILLIGLLGRMLVGSRRGYHHSSRRRDSRSAGIGIALIAIGYAGTVCGNLIKAAVSRQREFLADAGAVQFTRNPEGIAGALKKIAQGSAPQSVDAANAEQYSHFYFSGLRASFMSGLFATHPALDERIKRLGYSAPQGTGEATYSADSTYSAQAHHAGTMGFAGTDSHNNQTLQQTITQGSLNPEALVASVGNPSSENLELASEQLKAMPSALEQATHDAFSAQALVYAMLIHFTDGEYHANQLNGIKSATNDALANTTQSLLKALEGVSFNQCHNLVLMAENSLQDQSHEQAATFKKVTQALIQADRQFSLFEWCLYRLAVSPFEMTNQGKLSLKDCEPALSMVFFYVASFCDAEHRQALISNVSTILRCSLRQPEKISLKRLDKAIAQLIQLKPLAKPQLLKALVAAIQADHKITEKEIALLRMVALILDCPVPAITATL